MAKISFGNVYMLRSVDITNETNIRFINWRLNVLFIATYSEPVNVSLLRRGSKGVFFFGWGGSAE